MTVLELIGAITIAVVVVGAALWQSGILTIEFSNEDKK